MRLSCDLYKALESRNNDKHNRALDYPTSEEEAILDRIVDLFDNVTDCHTPRAVNYAISCASALKQHIQSIHTSNLNKDVLIAGIDKFMCLLKTSRLRI